MVPSRAIGPMSILNRGRTRLTYVLLVACVGLFSFLLIFVPSMSLRLWLWVMLCALVASVACIVLFQMWFSNILARRDSAIQLLNRVTSGDLALSPSEIRSATQSARMSTALHALVANLDCTIRRFGQLATDVSAVSSQISGRSRVIARSSREQ